jgi:hypothetical protein
VTEKRGERRNDGDEREREGEGSHFTHSPLNGCTRPGSKSMLIEDGINLNRRSQRRRMPNI